MTDRASLRQSLRQPLPLAYHPPYRFYEGGALTRQFRGLPERPDDWWSRFSIAIVAAGDGWAEGDFGRQPIRKGQTFAWPASLALRVRAGQEPVRIVRCLGPQEA
jgi:hypothetical protein